MDGSVAIRAAREEDRPFLDAFSFDEGMDNVPSLEHVMVAADEQDDPIGFIRIAFGPSGDAYVNPVVVNELWRGRGVGRALVEDALARHGSLKLVARGASIPFYRTLGFEGCSWEDIEQGVSEDCDRCSWRDECAPLPMAKRS